MNTPLDRIAKILKQVKFSNDGSSITACCPAHDDHTPSLSITQRDGRTLLHCYAGCGYEDIVTALNNLDGSLFESKNVTSNLVYKPTPVSNAKPNLSCLSLKQPDQIWKYLDETGELVLGYICRWNKPDGSKEIRPITPWENTNGAIVWQPKAFPNSRPLYGLEILSKRKNDPVLIVEGEKATDCARQIKELSSYVIVTWSGGAKAVSKTDWSPLKGRDIKIWPDNDKAGFSAAQEIKNILKEL